VKQLLHGSKFNRITSILHTNQKHYFTLTLSLNTKPFMTSRDATWTKLQGDFTCRLGGGYIEVGCLLIIFRFLKSNVYI